MQIFAAAPLRRNMALVVLYFKAFSLHTGSLESESCEIKVVPASNWLVVITMTTVKVVNKASPISTN